jgi:N-acetylglucosaminyl-diphospho-decaprenol L-rhamnosyltransferase
MNKVVYLDTRRRRTPPIATADMGSNGNTSDLERPAIQRTVQVSIVMVSFHTGPVLDEAIDTVLAQDVDLELIIVDNGNPEEVTAALKNRTLADSRIEVLTGHGNVGYAAGCNLGAKEASGKYLLLLNPDCVLQHGALSSLIQLAEGAAHPWVAGCRIVNPDGTDQRGSRRELPTPWLTLVEVLRLDRMAPNHPYFRRLNQHNLPLPEVVSAVPAVSGACMLTPLDDYRTIGGMDERYYLHVEDLDLCFFIAKAGGTVLFVPQVSVVHHKSTSDASATRIEWHKARGFTQYFRKNFTGLYPDLFLTAVNVLVWCYFVMRLASMARTWVVNLVTSLFRNGGALHATSGKGHSGGKDGRKGRAA